MDGYCCDYWITGRVRAGLHHNSIQPRVKHFVFSKFTYLFSICKYANNLMLWPIFQVHNSRFCPKTYSQIIIIIHYKVMPSYSLLFTIHANYPKPNLDAFILNLYQVINYHICFNSKFYIIIICSSSRLHVSFTYAQFYANLHIYQVSWFTCLQSYAQFT